MNYYDDYGFLSKFAESGGELAAVKQRLDYQAMSGYGTYEGTNGAPEVVSATLMYPFGGELTEMSATDRYRFGGKEFDTRGGLFHYDFEARHYDPVLPMFNGYDPMAEDNIHVSPLAYCHGNPVMFIDPTGMTIQGNTREDAVNLVSDIRSIFKDEAFNQFRDLITQSGKKHNGKSLEKISDEALKLAFDGISLTEDQQALVDVVVNTINSEDKHIVEYSKGEGNISANALSAMYDGFKNLPMSVILSANGGFPVAFVKNMGGGGLTAQTQKGSYTVIVDEPSLHEYGRPLTTGHEIFGHGRSLALGRISNDQQHIDAIQMENLIRRVMGIKSVNDGRNHMNGKIISNPNELPGYR